MVLFYNVYLIDFDSFTCIQKNSLCISCLEYRKPILFVLDICWFCFTIFYNLSHYDYLACKMEQKNSDGKEKIETMDEIFDKVKRAIVKIYKGKRFIGYATIIEGGYILTAAHCVNSSKIVAPLLSDLYCVKIKTKMGYILVNIEAMEVMCDIAVLKGAIHADLLDDLIKYNELIEETIPIEIDCVDKEVNEEFDVFIHNKDGSWVPGTAKVHISSDQPMILITSSSKINPGASGSPIINLDGQIVGVLSNCYYDGIAPRPHITLPVYMVKQLNLD